MTNNTVQGSVVCLLENICVHFCWLYSQELGLRLSVWSALVDIDKQFYNSFFNYPTIFGILLLNGESNGEFSSHSLMWIIYKL